MMITKAAWDSMTREDRKKHAESLYFKSIAGGVSYLRFDDILPELRKSLQLVETKEEGKQ